MAQTSFGRRSSVIAAVLLSTFVWSQPLAQQKAGPVFADGQAQIVPAFQDAALWIKESLWVETEFDSDNDKKKDRVFVDVTRPQQTDTEGLKVPVIYASSPYYAGTANDRSTLWDVKQELGDVPPVRKGHAVVAYQATRASVSNSLVNVWVPRGFAVVHSDAPGTGRSRGGERVPDRDVGAARLRRRAFRRTRHRAVDGMSDRRQRSRDPGAEGGH